jgi:phosphopantothenoylcysteine decarboxylase / phosphopantothenate---cysteine ligase
MQQQKIILAITAGIAAYKTPDLVRRLRENNFDVQVVMSKQARKFVTPLSLQAVSAKKVRTSLWDQDAEAAMGHIELARWADSILIAPATADIIAKLAHGLADDLISTLCLATTAKIIIAPAMNQQMWQNKITQQNIAALKQHGVIVLGPGIGEQACGEVGPGRMLVPDEIVAALLSHQSPQFLKHKKILITAGPTQEEVDPVRYFTNHSSGKMGYALAAVAASMGATVTLISGPTNLVTPNKVHRIDVVSAEQMHQQVMQHINGQDIFIAAAAVADYRPEKIASHKIKKTDNDLTLKLVRNPDILLEVAKLPNKPFIIGFAAETQNLLENATSKLQAKQCDMLVANLVGNQQAFGQDENNIVILRQGEKPQQFAASKEKLASIILFNLENEDLFQS